MFFRHHHRHFGRFWRLAALTGGVGLMAAGCHRHFNPEHRIESAADRIKNRLDLNEAQTVILNEARDEAVKLSRDMRDGRKDELSKLIAMAKQPELDSEAIKGMLDRHRAVMEQRMPAIVDKVTALHKTLNDSQKKELVEFLEKAEKWMTR